MSQVLYLVVSLCPRTHLSILIASHSCNRDGTVAPNPLAPRLTPHIDKGSLESVLFGDGSQPQHNEKSPRGVGSGRR